MHVLRMLSLTLLVAALGAAPALAQQSAGADADRTLTSSALDAVVADHESAADQQRAQLADLLAQDEVQDVARDRGIDMERVETAAAGFTNAQVNAVSPLVATIATAQENGGLGSVTISVVALIVILLVLILVT